MKFIYALASLFINKPNVQYIAPKMMNIFFTKAVSPKMMTLNLDKFRSISFDVELQALTEEMRENGKKVNHQLFALVDGDRGVEKIVLAEFESKLDATEALQVMNVKMYGGQKTLITTVSSSIVVLLLVGVVWIIADTLISPFFKPAAQVSQVPQMQNQMSQQVNPNQLNAQQIEMLKQQSNGQIPQELINELMSGSVGQGQAAQQQSTQRPTNPNDPANVVIQGLKK